MEVNGGRMGWNGACTVRYSAVGLGLTVHYSAVALWLTVHYSAVGVGVGVKSPFSVPRFDLMVVNVRESRHLSIHLHSES